MDTITVNKLLNIYNRKQMVDLEKYLTKEEISELLDAKILFRYEDDLFTFRKNNLYKYAKNLSKNGEYNLATIIFKGLLELDDSKKDTSVTVAAINTQLLKTYIRRGSVKKAYEFFKELNKTRTTINYVIANVFKYILKKPKNDEEIPDNVMDLLSENQFEEVINAFKESNYSDHQKEILKTVCNKATEVKELNKNTINKYLDEGLVDEAYNYLETIKKDNQSDSTLGVISSLLRDYILIKNNTISEASIVDLATIIDTYRSGRKNDVYASMQLDSFYIDTFDKAIQLLNEILKKSKYCYYVKNEASRLTNIISHHPGVIILNDLATLDNQNFLNIAKKNKLLKYQEIDNSYGKKIVVYRPNDKVIVLDDILTLYNNKEYHKCLTLCLQYISKNPKENLDGYYYAALCYEKLNNHKEATDFMDCYYFLQLNDKDELQDKTALDAKFYGINNLNEIIDFANTYNVSLELACLNYGLSEAQIEIVGLLIAKNYYAINEQEKGDKYLEYSDGKNYICKSFKNNVRNNQSYSYIDYNKAKDFINKLELKK